MLKSVLYLVGIVVAIALFAPSFLQNVGNTQSGAGPRTERAQAAVTDHGGIMRIDADRRGHYNADIEINGRRFGALVDTGATQVALRFEDARALGLVFPGDNFDVQVRTANGIAKAKRVELRSVRLGTITIRDVEGLVMSEGLLGQNLLGMSFLRRLSRVEVQRGQLVLER
jgi:aspartyl protease family protein